MLIKILFIILIGLSAGGVTATGLFALISSIGLINRYADVTNTTESIMLYEEMIIFGAGIGNIWYIFELPIKLGVAGVAEGGNSGFRFVRIDMLDDNAELHIKEVRAISVYRDISYKGSFISNDEVSE